MIFSLGFTNAAEFINEFMKNGVDVKRLAKFCVLVTNLTVGLMQMRKAIFYVNENVLPLEFGR